MAIPIKEDEFGKFYQCGSCNVWWPLEPSSMGAIGNGAVYCPVCTEDLSLIELDLYKEFIEEHKQFPTNDQLACMKRIVWQWLALPLNTVEVIYNGQS